MRLFILTVFVGQHLRRTSSSFACGPWARRCAKDLDTSAASCEGGGEAMTNGYRYEFVESETSSCRCWRCLRTCFTESGEACVREPEYSPAFDDDDGFAPKLAEEDWRDSACRDEDLKRVDGEFVHPRRAAKCVEQIATRSIPSRRRKVAWCLATRLASEYEATAHETLMENLVEEPHPPLVVALGTESLSKHTRMRLFSAGVEAYTVPFLNLTHASHSLQRSIVLAVLSPATCSVAVWMSTGDFSFTVAPFFVPLVSSHVGVSDDTLEVASYTPYQSRTAIAQATAAAFLGGGGNSRPIFLHGERRPPPAFLVATPRQVRAGHHPALVVFKHKRPVLNTSHDEEERWYRRHFRRRAIVVGSGENSIYSKWISEFRTVVRLDDKENVIVANSSTAMKGADIAIGWTLRHVDERPVYVVGLDETLFYTTSRVDRPYFENLVASHQVRQLSSCFQRHPNPY